MDHEPIGLHQESEEHADLEEAASLGSLDDDDGEHRPYSDVAPNSPIELASIAETTAVASLHDVEEQPPITIAPENVQVVQDDRLFEKNV